MKISRFQKSLLFYQPELTSKQQLTERFPYFEVVAIGIEDFEPPVVLLSAF